MEWYLYILNSLRIELEENKKNTNDININWIEHFKKAKNVNALSRTIIDEFIDNILIDQNGGINIIFKYKNEYNDALKFLDSYNVWYNVKRINIILKIVMYVLKFNMYF